ncbi:MAG: hypothetical protein Q7R80_02910 [bacterium]|nr:hypothetical protein [bacterium]
MTETEFKNHVRRDLTTRPRTESDIEARALARNIVAVLGADYYEVEVFYDCTDFQPSLGSRHRQTHRTIPDTHGRVAHFLINLTEECDEAIQRLCDSGVGTDPEDLAILFASALRSVRESLEPVNLLNPEQWYGTPQPYALTVPR